MPFVELKLHCQSDVLELPPGTSGATGCVTAMISSDLAIWKETVDIAVRLMLGQENAPISHPQNQ